MAEIERYVLVNGDDVSEGFEYGTASEAIAEASKRDEPMAVMARTYVYDDSEVVWTSTGDNTWPPEDDKTYQIVRFHMNAPREVIETGLSLDEAQEHCNRDDTRGEGWFDGYEEED